MAAVKISGVNDPIITQTCNGSRSCRRDQSTNPNSSVIRIDKEAGIAALAVLDQMKHIRQDKDYRGRIQSEFCVGLISGAIP